MSENQFGDWLRQELRRREWNLSDFARRADVNASMVSRWARGERRPSVESIDIIADVLMVDRSDVYRAAGYPWDAPDGDGDGELGRIINMLKRVDLTRYDRAGFLEQTIRGWIKFDREHSEGDG